MDFVNRLCKLLGIVKSKPVYRDTSGPSRPRQDTFTIDESELSPKYEMYRVDGVGRDTGRRRSRSYRAASIEEAIRIANLDGTIVDVASVVAIPPKLGSKTNTPECAKALEIFTNYCQMRRMCYLEYIAPGKQPTIRLVQPHDAVGFGDRISAVRCWQISPEEGWRCFRLDRVRAITDSGFHFSPQSECSLLTGLVTRFNAS